jgi:hypothetical protein
MKRLIIIASLVATFGVVLLNTSTYGYAVRQTLAPLNTVAGAISTTTDTAANTNR